MIESDESDLESGTAGVTATRVCCSSCLQGPLSAQSPYAPCPRNDAADANPPIPTSHAWLGAQCNAALAVAHRLLQQEMALTGAAALLGTGPRRQRLR